MTSKPQERNLLIELKHPRVELEIISDALEALSKPGISKQEIYKHRRIIQEARLHQKLLRAYTRYQKSQAILLAQEIGEKLREKERGKKRR